MLRILLPAAAATLAVALAGCGTGGYTQNGDSSNGKGLFVQKCGGCHILADAGTKGTTGPNLDSAFRFAREQGFEEETFRQVVNQQMREPIPPMPPAHTLFAGTKDLDKDIEDVATYVASVAGEKPAGSQASAPPAQAQPPQGGGASAAAQGKTIFSQQCAACHTLKAAGASGNVGPNLDQVKPDAARVQHQVENGGGGMPAFKGQLTPEQIKAVASFVASSAGK